MAEIKGQMEAKNGAPVLPNKRSIFEHGQEMFLKLSRMKPDRMRELFNIRQQNDSLLFSEVARELSDELALFEAFDKAVGTKHRIIDDFVYLIPDEEHDGRGFVQLQLADELEYWNHEDGCWKSGELFSTSYKDYEGNKALEILDLSDGVKLVDPILIRRLTKGG